MRRLIALALLALTALLVFAAPAHAQSDVVVADTPEWMKFTVIALAGTGLYAIVNLIAYVRGGDWNAVVKNLLAFAGGVAFIYWLSNAEITENLVLIEGVTKPLRDLDFASKLFLGVGVGALPIAGVGLLQAVDDKRSSKAPPIVRGADGME